MHAHAHAQTLTRVPSRGTAAGVVVPAGQGLANEYPRHTHPYPSPTTITHVSKPGPTPHTHSHTQNGRQPDRLRRGPGRPEQAHVRGKKERKREAPVFPSLLSAFLLWRIGRWLLRLGLWHRPSRWLRASPANCEAWRSGDVARAGNARRPGRHRNVSTAGRRGVLASGGCRLTRSTLLALML